MKKHIDKYLHNLKSKLKSLLLIIDRLIEHRLFKPVSIVIIASFLLFQTVSYVKNLIIDYKESQEVATKSSPIKINVLGREINFDLKEDQVMTYKVKSGDTMLKIFLDMGAKEGDIFNILQAMRKVYSPKLIVTNDKITIKYKLTIDYDTNKAKGKDIERKVVISSLAIRPSIEQEVLVLRKRSGEYEAKMLKIELNRQISKYMGVINNSLFIDAVASGVSPNTVMNMIDIYSYDVDFQRDIHGGDKFEILVESFYDKNGKKVKDGNVLYSSLALSGKEIEIYAHEVNNGIEYFDAKGNSARKSLLRTPLPGARISSKFGMRRHPVLGYSKLHKGVDFAAPRGTPIYAAGSGKITWYGRKGSYGNFVRIKHNSEYSTGYAHASRLSKRFRNGSRVKQGDVIAYVGTTGRSTGPHLHFEVLRRGKAINPSKVKATSGVRLKGRDLKRFQDSKNKIDQYRKNIPNQVKT